MSPEQVQQALLELYNRLPAPVRPYVLAVCVVGYALALLLALGKRIGVIPAVDPQARPWLYRILIAADYVAANSTTTKTRASSIRPPAGD